ncbi:MAG: hypothetical protein RLZZ618_2998 [Pseudomonadota bacterium]|jgi:hypothetical protein
MSPSDSTDQDTVWCDERRAEVMAYLERLGLPHGRVGEVPAFFARPYASIWAVESRDRPEWIGHWVIAGDLPNDSLPAHDLATPRDAMRAFGKRWALHGADLDRGVVHPAWQHLPDEQLPKFTATLKSRGAALQLWADDNAAWGEPAPEADADD